MRITEILTEEHRVIEQVLACLEEMAAQADATGRLDGAAARQAVDFFRNFADRCHHGKEEQQLFPALESRGVAHEHGPIGRMLYEHDRGRELLHTIEDAIPGAEAGEVPMLGRFIDQARRYVAWLRDHIAKEDNVLFPLADRILSARDQNELGRNFSRVESEEMGEGTHEKYLALANALADRFQVSRAVVVGSCGCCHHAH